MRLPLGQRRALLILGLAFASASLQIAIATRWGGRGEFISVLVLGWCGVLFLTWLRRPPMSRIGMTPSQIVLGTALCGGACAMAVATRAAYHTVDRFMPLVAGIGLAVMWSGIRRVPGFWRELAMLALTLLYPLPFAIQQALMPTKLTAATAAVLLRILGVPATREGTVLQLPESTLRVFDACSGMVLMTQMLVLAILLLCFFPTTLLRASLVGLAAIATGFVVNATRIALLALVALRVPSDFEYWESYVAGSALFPIVATALAGAVWWLVLRAPDRAGGKPLARVAVRPT